MDLLTTLLSASGLLIAGANVAFFVVIKFNDFAHMERNIKEISDKLSVIDGKLDKTAERVAKIEGILEVK